MKSVINQLALYTETNDKVVTILEDLEKTVITFCSLPLNTI